AIATGLVGVDPDPHFVDHARHRVLLHAEIGHPPGVDHVLRGHQQPHLRAGRYDQRPVDVEQVVGHGIDVGTRLQLPRQVALVGNGRVEADVGTQVLVLPLPLVTGHLDREFGVAGVLDLDQYTRGRYRHQHQDPYRDQGPDDFGLGAVDHRGIGDGAFRSAEPDHRPDHPAEHEDADGDAPPEDHHVQRVDLL